MSRAFTKEDGWEEPVIAPRAPLPDGVPNYVTARGLALLQAELAALDAERLNIEAAEVGDDERRRRRAVNARRAGDLATRLGSAQVVTTPADAQDAVRFGARVVVRDAAGEESRFEIVGVDEADPEEGRVAFTSPIARALLGGRAGQVVALRTGRGDEKLTIVSFAYDSDARP